MIWHLGIGCEFATHGAGINICINWPFSEPILAQPTTSSRNVSDNADTGDI